MSAAGPEGRPAAARAVDGECVDARIDVDLHQRGQSARVASRGAGPRLGRVAEMLATERRLVGLALLRITVSLLILFYLLGQWQNRHLLWGPDGAVPGWLFLRELPANRAPSLLATDSPLLFELIYHLTVVVAACYLAGWKTVPVGVAFAGLTWSLLRRNELAMTGGDALLLLALPWLMVTNTSAYLSADSGWRSIGSSWRPPPRPWRALIHNVGLFGLLLQLSTMYLFAGLHKLSGPPWLEGTAAGAVLRVDRFALPSVSPLLYESDLIGRVVTYWTLLFELTAPLLLWWPTTRWMVAVQSALFHGGIGVVMGLVTFAVEVTMFQLVVFPDSTYRRVAAILPSVPALLDRRSRRAAPG